MFHTQNKWLWIFRLLAVFLILNFLFFSLFNQSDVSSSFLFFSEYGIIILIRVLVQIYLAHKNNSQIQHLMRNKMIEIIEKKEQVSLEKKKKRYLLSLPNYRHFRSQLHQDIPHLQNPLIWANIFRQLFIELGFTSTDDFPPVFIEIPLFRPESFQEVQDTIESLRFQSYPAIEEILICFNDPTNITMRDKIYSYIFQLQKDDKRLRFLSLPTASKRSAMFAGFLRHVDHFEPAFETFRQNSIQINTSLHQLIDMKFQDRKQLDSRLNTISVNIDGDTQVDPDAIALGVLLLLLDPKTSAITSNVEIRNPRHNLLSKLTAARYKSANVLERAAQSSLYSVRCMSGPFMMFWTRNAMSISPRGKNIAQEWVSERFLNVKVEPGDDRSWTVRHNEQGFGVRFHPDILVTTDCPVSWQRWCKQQLRWMRSCNRNFIISLPFLLKMPLYVILDDLYLFFFPILLLIISVRITWQVIQLAQSPIQFLLLLFPYFLVIFFVQFLRSAHLAFSQKNSNFLYLSLYFLIYLRYLVWLRIVSFFTITQSEWAGRTSNDFAADQAVLKGHPM